MRILIRGGTVVTATGSSAADVLIDGETVAALLDPAHTGSFAGLADRSIDATGKYVIPGGIDVHTHLDMPFGGTFSADDFETGTRAAAWGGTTSLVDFAVQPKGSSLRETLDAWHAKAEGKASIDYGFHMIISDVNEQTLKEMDVLQAMQRAASSGATIMMHAENGIAIDVLVAQALASGHTDPGWHGRTRPPELEGEATARAIRLAQVTGAPLYIVHLSAQQALQAVIEARDDGRNVFAETCPQYLYLSQDDLDAPGFEGAKYVCSPPVRPKEHWAHLWRGLRTNDLSIVSTDHCPFCFKEQKEMGRGDFSKIPNGMPGIEHRVDLLHQGVVDGELSLARWVEVNSTTPARMFGLYPRKGTIAPGSDADIVVYDPALRHVLSVETHHMAVDYSAYEGREVQGGVSTVLSRGEILVSDGQWHGQAGRGRFLPRGASQYLR